MIRVLLIICALILLKFPCYSQDGKRPNILFIISDDLSAQALSVYAEGQSITPNIDQLAREGVQFMRAYCQFPVCGPSRASLLSGMYPEKLGILNNGNSSRIEDALGEKTSLPEFFKTKGYRTIRLGKIYHMRVPGDITAGVDGPDHTDSWDEKFNFQGQEWMTPGDHEHLSNEKLKFDPDVHYNLGFGTAFYTVKGRNPGNDQPDYRATSKAIKILDEYNPENDPPFFLALGFVRPHVPLVAPQSYYQNYPYSEMSGPDVMKEDQEDIPALGIHRTTKNFGLDRKPDLIQKTLAAYYSSVAFMDAQVGRVLRSLRKNGLAENTIVIFMSDHGFHLGEHDFWQKLSLHEESVRTPLIIAGPQVGKGQSFSLVEHVDIFPSLVDLSGYAIPAHLQGKSIIGVFNDLDLQNRHTAYSVNNRGRLLRTSKWAYMQYRDGSEELYNMLDDSAQLYNLARNQSFEDELQYCRRLLQERVEYAGGEH